MATGDLAPIRRHAIALIVQIIGVRVLFRRVGADAADDQAVQIGPTLLDLPLISIGGYACSGAHVAFGRSVAQDRQSERLIGR